MAERRFLIVNADDFGQSLSVNSGIIHAHRQGIVTSASLMVRHAPAADAAEQSRACPALSLGLHVDLGEWRVFNNEWVPVYEVVRLDNRENIRDELARQLAKFWEITGRTPSHIDSHQHVHLREPVLSVIAGTARELGVPLRRCDPNIGYCGEFYGQDIDGSPLPDRIAVDGLIRSLTQLPPGVTELCCHPAAGEDVNSMYSAERRQELTVLCDGRVREAVARLGITLCSFEEINSINSSVL